MIDANVRPERASFVARLTAKAAALAEARAELRRRSDPRRWRTPRLLWPLFTKGR
jgi:hypothetical protein